MRFNEKNSIDSITESYFTLFEIWGTIKRYNQPIRKVVIPKTAPGGPVLEDTFGDKDQGFHFWAVDKNTPRLSSEKFKEYLMTGRLDVEEPPRWDSEGLAELLSSFDDLGNRLAENPDGNIAPAQVNEIAYIQVQDESGLALPPGARKEIFTFDQYVKYGRPVRMKLTEINIYTKIE